MAKKRFENPYPDKCGFQFDRHNRRVKPCRGKVRVIEGVRVCDRHWQLIQSIAQDANQGRGRHPVHKARSAA